MVASIFEPDIFYDSTTANTINVTASSDTVIVFTDEWSCTAGTDTSVLQFNYTTTTGSSDIIVNDVVWERDPEKLREWNEHYRRERENEEKRKKKIQDRARELLKRHLTPRQWSDYIERGHFFVKTRKGHLYQITAARDHNIIRLNKRRKPMRVLCVSIYEVDVPVEDIMLAQKLFLETQEDRFLKIANHWAVSSAQGLRRAA